MKLTRYGLSAVATALASLIPIAAPAAPPEGEITGHMAALLYCEVAAIEYRPPISSIPGCDTTTERSCRTGFMRTVNNYPACKRRSAADRDFRDQLDFACSCAR